MEKYKIPFSEDLRLMIFGGMGRDGESFSSGVQVLKMKWENL